MKRISDFAVIGLGCAGMGAYLQIKKESENIMLFERGRVGGDLYHANSVENLLFSKSLRGADACRLIKKQVEGEKIIRDNCLSVSEEKGFVTIKTERKEYVCRYAVVATGREQKKIGFSFGKQKHFSSEAKGNKICIIGGGERALDCAVSLIEKNKEVSVVSTGTFSKVNASLLRESSQAVFYTDSSVMDIAKAEKYIVKFEFGGEILNKEYDDIIISIGTKTRQPIICREENGRILLAGSVRGIRFSQCAAAFADGARAVEWLVKKMRSNNESNRK